MSNFLLCFNSYTEVFKNRKFSKMKTLLIDMILLVTPWSYDNPSYSAVYQIAWAQASGVSR